MSSSRPEVDKADFDKLATMKLNAMLDAYINGNEDNNAVISKAAIGGAELSVLHSGNNTIFKATHKTATAAVNISSPTETADVAVTALAKPNWLANIYRTHSKTKQIGNIVTRYTMRLTEFCPGSFDAIANKLQQNHNPEAAVQAASNLGRNLAAILTEMSKKNVAWTDLKPGNILFRENGEIVIADTKGLLACDRLPLAKDGSVVFSEISNGYCTRAFVEQSLSGKISPNEAKSLIEQEN